jgi:hypothetical protein
MVVLPCHSTRPPSTAPSHAFAQVEGPVFLLPPLGTVLRPGPGEALVHPTDPLVASLPVQRRLAPGGVAELVAAYRRGVPVEELASSRVIGRRSSATSGAMASRSGIAGHSKVTRSTELPSSTSGGGRWIG